MSAELVKKSSVTQEADRFDFATFMPTRFTSCRAATNQKPAPKPWADLCTGTVTTFHIFHAVCYPKKRKGLLLHAAKFNKKEVIFQLRDI